jgi:hypothetical protein
MPAYPFMISLRRVRKIGLSRISLGSRFDIPLIRAPFLLRWGRFLFLLALNGLYSFPVLGCS